MVHPVVDPMENPVQTFSNSSLVGGGDQVIDLVFNRDAKSSPRQLLTLKRMLAAAFPGTAVDDRPEGSPSRTWDLRLRKSRNGLDHLVWKALTVDGVNERLGKVFETGAVEAFREGWLPMQGLLLMWHPVSLYDLEAARQLPGVKGAAISTVPCYEGKVIELCVLDFPDDSDVRFAKALAFNATAEL